MLRVILGEKGAGKTKRIIDEANSLLETAKGNLVYIDDDKSYTLDINTRIRFIDASEYNLTNPDMFLGFISGIAAQDYDLEAMYIDGFLKIVRTPLYDLETLFEQIGDFAVKNGITVTISINYKLDEAPDFLRKFIV